MVFMPKVSQLAMYSYALPAHKLRRLNHDHFKIFLASTTFRASPVHRHICPARTRCNPFIRQAGSFVVDPAADQAHPGFEFFIRCYVTHSCLPFNQVKWKVEYLNLLAVQNQTSPLILSFNASDPVGAVGVQADLACFAAMGCHGLSVVTTILIGDTTRIEDSQVIDVDCVSDQARVVLEDMPVAAFKVGAVGSIENVSVIAEIVADYPDIPLILDPFLSALPDRGEDSEDLLVAIRELLIPQTTVLVTSSVELGRLAETWREPTIDDTLTADAMRIIDLGCEYLFVTGTPSDVHDVANTLFSDSGVVRQDNWQRISGSFTGAGTTLSATIAALLANGMEVPEAIFEAQEFTVAALTNAHRLGMGKLVPDRYFWTREPEDTPAGDTESPLQ